MRIRLHSDENEVILEFPAPEEWKPVPMVILLPLEFDQILFVRRGIQDAVAYYWPETTRTLEPCDRYDCAALAAATFTRKIKEITA